MSILYLVDMFETRKLSMFHVNLEERQITFYFDFNESFPPVSVYNLDYLIFSLCKNQNGHKLLNKILDILKIPNLSSLIERYTYFKLNCPVIVSGVMYYKEIYNGF